GDEAPTELASFMTALVHPEDLPLLQQALAAHLEGDQPFEAEFRMRAEDGQYRWFIGRGQAVRDTEGTPVRMLGFLRDVTEQRTLEQKLRNSYKLEAIGRLAGGIAHDFNNILYAMLGYAEFVREELEPHSEAADHIS